MDQATSLWHMQNYKIQCKLASSLYIPMGSVIYLQFIGNLLAIDSVSILEVAEANLYW